MPAGSTTTTAVEFQTLDDTDRHERDASVEAGPGRSAVIDAGRSERFGQFVNHPIGRNDAEAGTRYRVGQGLHFGRHGLGQQLGR